MTPDRTVANMRLSYKYKIVQGKLQMFVFVSRMIRYFAASVIGPYKHSMVRGSRFIAASCGSGPPRLAFLQTQLAELIINVYDLLLWLYSFL